MPQAGKVNAARLQASNINVVIVGAGMAGLTAALRLAERGFAVTIYEEKDYIGGKFGAHQDRREIKKNVDEIVKSLRDGKFPSELRKKSRVATQVAALPDDVSVSYDARKQEWQIRNKGEPQCVIRQEGNGRKGQILGVYSPFYREHGYHMFLNWYENFWQIVEEDLGLGKNFEPRETIKYLRKYKRAQFPQMAELTNVGSPKTLLDNLLSGVAPAPDMFLYGYSLIDLLATPFRPDKLLDDATVNGFMYSRPYATERSAELHHYTLAKAFANPSYLSAAASYQNFIKYGFHRPEPMLWILKGNSYEYFFQDLGKKLEKLKVQIHLRHSVTKIVLEKGRGAEIKWVAHDMADFTSHGSLRKRYRGEEEPDGEPDERRYAGKEGGAKVDYLILAVPPTALTRLIDEKIIEVNPELGEIQKLQSEPVASLDLYFNKRLSNIPKEHTILLDSQYELTFIDNSQAWSGYEESPTFLSIGVSNFRLLIDLIDLEEKKVVSGIMENREEEKAIKYIIKELKEYIHFKDEDIDWAKTHLQTNLQDRLFIAEAGSWNSRPQAKTKIPNLFLAGDFCQTDIDVVTIEGAVVSGLKAAQALQDAVLQNPNVALLPDAKKELENNPIEVLTPDSYSETGMRALKLLLAPWAYGAQWWSWVNEQVQALDEDGTSASRGPQRRHAREAPGQARDEDRESSRAFSLAVDMLEVGSTAAIQWWSWASRAVGSLSGDLFANEKKRS